MKIHSYLTFIIVVLSSCSGVDSKQEIQQKVDILVAQMTLDEKVGQMTQVDMRMLHDIEDIKTYHLGSILSGGGSVPPDNSPEGWVKMVNSFQKKALNTRLGIPLIYGIDAVHGNNNVIGATVFPHNLALGSSQDADLIRRVNQATAVEVAATGMHWTFSPCIAIPQDPRWGRFYEGFGDTTESVNNLTEAAIKGYERPLEDIENRQIAACAKHIIGDGATQWNTSTKVEDVHQYYIDRGDAVFTDQEMRSIYLPPYKTAVDAGVKTIMASFNSIRGEKCHGSSYILTDVLKGELGFEGFVVSDWAGIDEIPGDYKSDIITSINAGMDMIMVPGNLFEDEDYISFIQLLKEAVLEGSISEERINDAVTRILKVKFEIGLFDTQPVDAKYTHLLGSDKHRALAREAVQKTTILLKNDGVLPLNASSEETLYVVGSAANNLGIQNGGWTTQWQGIYTPDFDFLDANGDEFLSKIEFESQLEKVYQAKYQTEVWAPRYDAIDKDLDRKVSRKDFLSFMIDTPLQPEGTTVLEALQQHNSSRSIVYDPNALRISEEGTIVAVIGEYPYAEGVGDDGDLQLNKADKEILQRCYASGNKVVVILLSGRPLMIQEELPQWDAFLASFLPGMAGEGIADVLFAEVMPLAKLSFTWPSAIENIETKEQPLFEYGFGLSY